MPKFKVSVECHTPGRDEIHCLKLEADDEGDAADEIALVEDAPAVVPDAQRWRKTAEEPPTEADANEDGDVLSINNNPCDGFITNWPWNMVAAFPENLPVWMPTPKKPTLFDLLENGA